MQLFFALAEDGNLYNLGNHGDWESAENTAYDLQIRQIWVFDENTAKSWADFIYKSIKQNELDIKKLEEV